jgi:putative membrane protein
MADAAAALPDATKLAVDRTRLAHDRTLLAWVRTSTSLISFGFTVYKFFQYLQENQQAAPSDRLFGPREFALLMIGTGVVVLVLATIDHRLGMKELREQYRQVPYSLATVLAALISLLGVVGLLAVVFRV